MNKPVIIFVVLLIIGVGGYYAISQNSTSNINGQESVEGMENMEEGQSMEEHMEMMDDGRTIMAMSSMMSPKVLYVNPGQEIRIANHEAADLKLIAENGEFETDLISSGEEGTFVVPNTVGTYKYYSSIAESVSGTLVVEEPNSSNETVSYLGEDGFSPSNLNIEIGTTVTFVNESDQPMAVAEGSHTDHGLFEQQQASRNGEKFEYTFNAAGTYSVHNHLDPDSGTVSVNVSESE